jgi:hypothetical protein
VEAIVQRGQAEAPIKFSHDRMIARYEQLFADLIGTAAD